MTAQLASFANSYVSALQPVEGQTTRADAVRATVPTNVERLPFTVRLVRNAEDLDKAVAIRHAAYARHVPEFAEKLRVPESTDFEEGVAVLLAESKLDGSPLGTMRIQTNQYKPLNLEQSVALPSWLQGASLAEAARLGITGERIGNMVKTVLFKAFFQYCQQNGIDWMVIVARSPIDRQYERMMFKDVYPDLGYIPMQHVNNMPHRVLGFEIGSAEARWAQAKHPLLGFMCYTNHPDIDIRQPLPEPSLGRSIPLVETRVAVNSRH